VIPLTDEEYKTNRFPVITVLIIAANIYFFVATTEATFNSYALNAAELLSGQNLMTLITSMFLHAGWLHIIFNMWSLWIFGDNVEDDLGFLGYLLLYFLSGVAGGFAFAFLAQDPINSSAVGASGAIAGVMGAYLVLHPRNRVLTLIPIGPFITTARITAPVFIILWFIIQFAGLYLAGADGIAYSAHVGGFITGLILSLLFRKNTTDQ
jgi:membrane associated rhomboid family serine protease